MNCADFQKLIPSLLCGELPQTEKSQIEAHLPVCPTCRTHANQLEQTTTWMRELGSSVTVRRDFHAELHAKLVLEPPPSIPFATRLWRRLEPMGLDSGRRLGFAATMVAACFLLTFATLRFRGENRAVLFLPDEGVAASFRIPNHRVAVVQLDFVADQTVSEVDFEISLPKELEFVDGGEPISERKLTWRGSLSAGSNPIPVAVRGLRPGQYRVVAQARGKNISVLHEVVLEVVKS
jgi:hypothetical protein